MKSNLTRKNLKCDGCGVAHSLDCLSIEGEEETAEALCDRCHEEWVALQIHRISSEREFNIINYANSLLASIARGQS